MSCRGALAAADEARQHAGSEDDAVHPVCIFQGGLDDPGRHQKPVQTQEKGILTACGRLYHYVSAPDVRESWSCMHPQRNTTSHNTHSTQKRTLLEPSLPGNGVQNTSGAR